MNLKSVGLSLPKKYKSQKAVYEEMGVVFGCEAIA
jgi:hypothetical protein